MFALLYRRIVHTGMDPGETGGLHVVSKCWVDTCYVWVGKYYWSVGIKCVMSKSYCRVGMR